MGKDGKTIRATVRLVPVAALAVLAIAASTAVAKPGGLDPTFGEAGRAATALDLGSSWKDATVEMATAPDSSILVASKRQIVSYIPSGQLDLGFGDNGIVTLDQVEGLSFELDDVAVDSAGRVVAFGTAVDPSRSFTVPGYSPAYGKQPTYAIVLRFDATGKLDPTFGVNGIVRTDFGLPMNRAEDGSRHPLIETVAGIVDSQNRPVLVAAQYGNVPTEGHSYMGWVSRIVARLAPGGQLDPSFGAGDGITVLASSGYEGLAATPTGGPLLVWGGAQVACLRADGQPEGAYGSAGVRTIRGNGEVALDRFGRLLILDLPRKEATHVLRLRPNGNLDRGFGRSGRATVALPMEESAVNSIAVDAHGRAILVGASSRAKAGAQPQQAALMIATRLQASGGADLAFGKKGWVRSGFGLHTKLAGLRPVHPMPRWGIVGPEAALDARGRLVVVAVAHSPQLQPGGIVLARYRMN